jgi:ATP-dependent DNA helicase RecG
MVTEILNNPIEFLKGVGPARGELLKKELNIFTFEDLLGYFPFRYVDRSKFFKISEISSENAYIQLKGRIKEVSIIGQGRAKRFVAIFGDETGNIELVWFQGIKWIQDKIKPGYEYIVFGKPTIFNGKYNFAHPETELAGDMDTGLNATLQPVYYSGEKLKNRGLDSRGISRLTKTLLLLLEGKIPETLPDYLLERLHFLPRKDTMMNIHHPENQQLLDKAIARLKFEEFFYIQLLLLKQKFLTTVKSTGHIFKIVGENFNEFYKNHLPFELTNAQKRVIREIRYDIGNGKQMNRLLQGDVGSGKTLVALMCMLIAIDNGFQTALMAPTEILARQHFNTINGFLKEMDISVQILTGSTKTSERKKIHSALMDGSLNILVGTHALIEDKVQFKNLGFVVIDEQHRFGVEQRAKLWKKNTTPPHVLVMTATPIPRTLAMTVYGDLEVSVIDELPPGRKPIQTFHFYDSKRAELFGFMRKKIAEGRQIYVVYPLINESETLDLKDLQDGYDSITRAFPLPDYAVSIVHGQMKPEEKDFEMQRFVKGETQIMVATTVIEVGVDVPNASVMVIENAERFGLSQLHQLRGRVGRGAEQSYCILMTSFKLTSDGRKRIETMVNTNDGFQISEVDLKLRGPGDLQGTQQSGVLDMKIADIVRDEKILKYARNLAIEIIKDDPQLEKPKNALLAGRLAQLQKHRYDWSRIS